MGRARRSRIASSLDAWMSVTLDKISIPVETSQRRERKKGRKGEREDDTT